MLRHFLNPPNWFSSASLFCGLYSMILATGTDGEPRFYQAGAMILFAGVFDMLDGRVARITGRGSAFGVQLDSLVDVVSFGVAPSVLLYSWGLDRLGWVGLVGAFSFVCCAAFRLARFNTEATEKPGAMAPGLTTTVAGATVAAAVMVHAASGRTSVQHPVVVWFLAVTLAVLMVSQVPYRTFKTARLSRKTIVAMTLVVGFMLAMLLNFGAPYMFLGVLAPLAASGLVEFVVRKIGGYDYPPELVPAPVATPKAALPELDSDDDDDVEEDSGDLEP